MSKIPCSVEILTFNNSSTIRRCLQSVQDFDDIIVLDGGSSDETVSISRGFGARVFPQVDNQVSGSGIQDFSLVRNKGLKLAKHNWFLYVDSDEYISPELGAEIRTVIKGRDSSSPGLFRTPRKYVLGNTVIERSAGYPNYQIRLFYIPAVTDFKKSVHEQIQPKAGSLVGYLNAPIYVPQDPLTQLKPKWSHYIDMQVSRTPLSLYRALWSWKGNIKKFLCYFVKYLLTFVRGKGPRMPFAYEWTSMSYHLVLAYRMTRAFLKYKLCKRGINS